MKHQTLRMTAFFLAILAGLMALVGLAVTVVVGIGAASTIARIGFVLGGFFITAVSAMMLLVASRLIYLFINIEEDLHQILAATRREGD